MDEDLLAEIEKIVSDYMTRVTHGARVDRIREACAQEIATAVEKYTGKASPRRRAG